jgi:hypothetical protein
LADEEVQGAAVALKSSVQKQSDAEARAQHDVVEAYRVVVQVAEE